MSGSLQYRGPDTQARINVITILTSYSVTLQCLYSDKRRRKYSSFRTANEKTSIAMRAV